MKNQWFATTFVVATLLAQQTAEAQPPAPRRELRGTWTCTVSNLDWPNSSQTPLQQKQALITQLNALQAMNINAVVFQIRSECDAMYVSNLEPWSRFLTGQQGRAPSPLYDPLQFAIDETRRRGMELHAWMNPYRAGVNSNSTFATSHVSRNGSTFVVTFETNYWLDPGNAQTIPYLKNIVQDVVNRYDVDSIHMDDYFYPYGITTDNPFPDTTSFAANNPTGLSLANWRRQNTRNLVSGVYTTLRTTQGKNHVRLGLSPFGIYRPNNPPGISGLDSYNSIFIDSRNWLQTGIVDYMCPQLYWGRAADGYPTQQDYDALIGWWTNSTQNPLGRHVFGGLPVYKVVDDTITDPQHLVNMVTSTRNTTGASGNIHFRTGNLISTSTGVGPLLQSGLWSQADALVPASTWLDNVAPAAPVVKWQVGNNSYVIQLLPIDRKDARWFVVQSRIGSTWTTKVLPGWTEQYTVANSSTAEIAVRSVDRSGNMSAITTILTSTTPTGLEVAEGWTVVQNFEAPANNATQVLFRVPSASGTTQGIATGSTTTVTNTEWNNRLDPRVTTPGTKSNRLQFSWSVAGQGQVRATTLGATTMPNPQLDLRRGLSIAVKLPAGSLDVSLLIRETNGAGPIGADGGSTGAIERTTAPIRVVGSANWQYLYFDLPKAKLESFSGGDGDLNGNFGVLEGLLLQAVPGNPTTAITFYVDDIYQGPEQRPFGEDIYRAELEVVPVFEPEAEWLFY